MSEIRKLDKFRQDSIRYKKRIAIKEAHETIVGHAIKRSELLNISAALTGDLNDMKKKLSKITEEIESSEKEKIKLESQWKKHQENGTENSKLLENYYVKSRNSSAAGIIRINTRRRKSRNGKRNKGIRSRRKKRNALKMTKRINTYKKR